MRENLQESVALMDDGDVQLKLKIMHAVDCSLDKLVVTDLCAKVGISRQTFYRNFDSKYMLHWWWPIHVHKFYLIEVGRTIDCETGYFHHIRLLNMERDFFKIATQYTLNSSCQRSIMPHYRMIALIETLQDYRGIDIDDELMWCISNWVKLETEILTEWYRLGTPPKPQDAVNMLIDVMPSRLYEALRIS